MKTKTIDEKVREKASAELTKQIKSALAPISRLLNCQYIDLVDIPESGRFHWSELELQIEYCAHKIHKDRQEQDAIDEFLSKVESLRDDVDELFNTVNQ